jgi:hypothetical protein
VFKEWKRERQRAMADDIRDVRGGLRNFCGVLYRSMEGFCSFPFLK